MAGLRWRLPPVCAGGGPCEKAGKVMRALQTETKPFSLRRTLLASGMGGVFGLEIWWIARNLLPGPIPTFCFLCIVISHILLGFSLGASGFMGWWKRGLIFGVVISPVTIGSLTVGSTRIVYGLAAMAATLIAALFIGLVSEAVFPRAITRIRPVQKHDDTLPMEMFKRAKVSTRDRLSEGRTCLEYLEMERESSGDRRFGRELEDRIIWRELLELELQDMDQRQDGAGHPLPPPSLF